MKGDVIGGATAAVVALPGFSLWNCKRGGSCSGFICFTFGGLTAAVFGGCGVQITGLPAQ